MKKWAVWSSQDGYTALIFDDPDLARAAAEKLTTQFPTAEIHLLTTTSICRRIAPVQWRKL